MKIVFTGGGTGGHFYPLIAISEAMGDLVREQHLLPPKLYFLGPDAFDEKALFENNIVFIRTPAGKFRRYWSWRNVTGIFVTILGVVSAILTLFRIYPDVVISKGGYGSLPTTLAARILRIPVIIHESDSKPGRANLRAASYASKIAITFDSSAKYFPASVQSKIARTGIPIRKALLRTEAEGAREYLGLEQGVPTALVLGGSQGSVRINDAITTALPDLVSFANIIHQTGTKNFTDVQAIAQVILRDNPNAGRYHAFDFLSEMALQRAAGAATVVISRAGSTSIAEIAMWKKPAILIPIPEEISHDQRTNAYDYAGTGAAVVIEEGNLTPHLLAAEVKRIATNPDLAATMAAAAAGFTDRDAAKILADAALTIALSHE